MSEDRKPDIRGRSNQPERISGDAPTLLDPNPNADANAPLVAVPRTVPFAADQGAAMAETLDLSGGVPDLSELPVIDGSSYAVGGELARGGIGRIIRARDARLRRPVAIKELLDTSGGSNERFVREALLTARLQHPAIVPVYEAGRWPSGEPFYAMKLVSGRSLDEVVEDAHSLEERIALLPHVLAVTDAIAYAHSEHIIHRDLKPHNILVGAFGETVVVDWGLAKDLAASASPNAADRHHHSLPGSDSLARNLTMTGSVMGTPAYMPPEQATGREVDERADVYALGAILYHVLAGVPPYDGKTSVQILAQVTSGPPVPLLQIEPKIPLELVTIVKKAMARERGARYRTAQELAEDLRRFQTGQFVSAHRYSPLELLLRFLRRYRAPLAVAAAALAVLFVAGAWGLRKIMIARDTAEKKQLEAETERTMAAIRADELTIEQARASLERDPTRTVQLLASLSGAFSDTSRARVLASDARARGLSVILRGHTGAVNAIAFAKTGGKLATASDDHTMRLWNLATLESRALVGHADEVWKIALSPDSRTLISAGKDKTARVWNLDTGASRALSGHAAPIHAIALSPDASRLATFGADGEGRLWDLRTDQDRPLEGHTSAVETATFNQAGDRLISASTDGTVRLWSASTGESAVMLNVPDPTPIAAYSPNRKLIGVGSSSGVWIVDIASGKSRLLGAIPDGVLSIAFTPDGGSLAAAAQDGAVRLYSVSGGPPRVFQSTHFPVLKVAVSPNGKLLAASGTDRVVRVWDIARGEARALIGFEDTAADLEFSPDEASIAAGSWDQTARIFSVTDGAPVVLTWPHKKILSMDLSPSGDQIVTTGDDGAAYIGSLAGGEPTPLAGHEGDVMGAVFSPEGDRVATAGADGAVRVFDLTGHTVWRFNAHEFSINSIVFSPDGRLVASSSGGSAVHIADTDSGEDRRLAGHEGGVFGLAFSPDGKWLASGGRDRTARLWNVETGEGRAVTKHDAGVHALAFSPNGAVLASSGADHTVRLTPIDGSEPRAFDVGGNGVTHLRFSPSGDLLLTIMNDTSIHVWKTATGERHRSLRGHDQYARHAAFSPDGRTIATASEDQTVRLWDLDTGESRPLRGHVGPVIDVRFSPDGASIISAGSDGTVRIWPDDLPRDLAELRAWLQEKSR